MRKPVLAGIFLGLLLLVTSTYSLDNVIQSSNIEDDNTWIPSASELLHRVKRQFNFFSWGAKPTTKAPDETTRGSRYTRSTSRESVTQSVSLLTDDEDLGGQLSGSGAGTPVSPTWVTGFNRKPRYYRISLILIEPYKREYEDQTSTEFRFLSETLTKAINELYSDVSGEQLSRVIKIQNVDTFKIRVFLDLSSVGNHNTDELKNRLKRQIDRYQRIDHYVIDKDIIFNEFGDCESSNQIPCRDNAQCFNQDARCDGKYDCADESDESGCERVETTSLTSESYAEVTVAGDTDEEEEKEDDFVGGRSLFGPRNESDRNQDVTGHSLTERPDRDEEKKPVGTPISHTRQDSCRADDKVRCASDNSIYICTDQECDGHPDCPGGSDELNCPSSNECAQGEFMCDMTRCILVSQKCDGKNDCQDGTDEADCPGCDFRCSDGTCLSYPQRCNIVKDCPDGEDEHGCLDDIDRCPPGDFTCRNGDCINADYRCDNIRDCSDNSDEEDCSAPMCLPGQIQCSDLQGCYFVNQTCDGRDDCSDRSDERDCACRSDEYKCRNGDCIPLERRCDGYTDCREGEDEDETLCRKECTKSQFRCRDGRCIDLSLVCDSYQDCHYGEDEESCPTDVEMPKCLDTEFRCRDNKCILLDYRCDGLEDCSDKSDEDNCEDYCGPKDHRCDGDTLCIKPSKMCDSYIDCKDGTDERDCFPECNWTQFRCDSGHCIPNVDRCNGRYDCADNTDESDCPRMVECGSFQFKCSSGDQCIHRSLYCDGRNDCRDGSDEWNCPRRPENSSQCSLREFKCLHGNQCIDKSKFCDGQPDCSDRSDEENCASAPVLDLKTYPPEQTIKESREVVFQCRDEGPGHIPVRWTRDGLPMPPNTRDHRGRLEIPNVQLSHSGTYYCEAQGVPKNSPGAKVAVFLRVEPFTVPTPFMPVCGPDEATCHNRECIPKNKVCDGIHDCGDGSDESRCSPWGCEPNEFSCDNKKCVRKSWVCDKDDDCGDGSDEKNCQLKPSGSLCFLNEFECADRKMCIPKWFHCDGHNDCHDGTDEIGCFPINIVEPPQAMVVVIEGDTLILTCRSTGVPTPIISWRLNWNHVPAKCSSTSIDGVGTLTCPGMTEADQGAYTCEALDFRHSVLAPDSHVIVKPKQPASCPRGSFNSAVAGVECTNCFCFGATTDCHANDKLYRSAIRPTIQVARFINVRYDPYRKLVEVRSSEPPIISQSAARVSPDNVVQASTSLSLGRRAFDQIYPYLALPEDLHGKQLNTYGGSLKYKIQFGGSSSSLTRTTTPDIILIGNGYTLAYNVTDRLIPQRDNEISVDFLPGNWKVIERPRGLDYDLTDATREDLLMALENIDNILVNFQYLEGEFAETTISDIRWDTAVIHSTERGIAAAVEQCRCPAGYVGHSCEDCDDGYMRSKDGLWLGRCEIYTPRVCPPRMYGDPSRRIPCKPCPCPLTNPDNQFGTTCRLDSDGQPTCDCPAGYSGRRCEVCSPGYTGNPMEPNGYCSAQLACDAAGSYSTSPDPRTGECDCKAHTTGKRCDQCKPDTFALNVRHQHGCIDCFCMGITEECTSSSLYRDEMKVVFSSGSQGFMIAPGDDLSRARNVSFDSGRWEIKYNTFEPKVYYWVLPKLFLGDKVTSYGGNLKYTLRYVPTPGGQSSRNNAPDVEIRSLNNINLVHRSSTPQDPGVESTVTVPLLEQYWTREDGGAVDRPHLLMALADLSAIYIKATYTTSTQEAGLMSVTLDTASSRNTGSWGRAVEVEQCRCPVGYVGTSCEDCDAGYTRTEDGLYLRFCEPCNCNNRSTNCHPETGVCENCEENTYGPRCEHCLPGFSRISDGSCRQQGLPCDCDRRGSTGPCIGQSCQCKINVIGSRCDQCRPGTYGLSETRPEGCFECYCSGITSSCQSSNLYREKIPTLVIDDLHGFTLLETSYSRSSSFDDGRSIRDGFSLDYSRNEVGYDIGRRPNQRYFWSLPSQLTGDKITSYGGQLSFKLRATSSTSDTITLKPDTHIILIGNGISLFRHFNDDVLIANYPKHFEVDLIDDGHWKIMNPTSSKTEASRIDMLKVLSSLEKILILASFGDNLIMTHISDVAMDTAVQSRGGQAATEVEVCRCPEGYMGTSCQHCAIGHYRNYDQTCRRCPCNNNEESCSLMSDNRVKCHCRPGFYGQQCENTGSEPVAPTEPPSRPTILIRISEPQIKIVAVGTTVRYNCSAISRLPGRRIIVSWSKEGGFLPSRAIKDDGLLIIPEVRESDSGVYICTASDGYSSQSEAVTLTVGGGSSRPVVRISQEFIEARIGEPLEITCSAEGTPRPSISWNREDGSPISPYSTQYEGHLRIDSLRRSDEGVYRCIASNPYGTESSTSQVRLLELPSDGIIVINPSGFSGLEGDNVYMTCSTTRNNSKVTWSRANGRSLPPSSRQSNGSLIFYGARSVDQGVYICTAYDLSSGRKITESQAIVNIGIGRQPPPVVTIEPDKQMIPQGTPAMIRCSSPQPGVSIRWSKRDDSIPPHIQINGDVLRIPSARVTDRGMYICHVEYKSGQLQKYAIVEVEPREAPTIELYPRTQQTLATGASMLLQCRASGIPTPNVYWSRPGNLSLPFNIQPLHNGVLRMNNVQVSDAGQYICHAENTAGSTTATANIEVHSPPVVRILPKGPIQLQAGQVLKLECNATGFPRPFVSWSRHKASPSRTIGYGSGLPDDLTSPSYDFAIYEAFSVSAEDEGLYLCSARNDAGTVEERVEVVINDNNVRPGFEIDNNYSYGKDDEQPDQYTTVIGGESMPINCLLRSSNDDMDRVMIEWNRADRQPLPEGSHQRNGVLYLNNVNKEAEGVYVCMLIDKDTGAVLKQIQTTVSVTFPPRITLQPQKQIVKVGDDAKILCSANGEEPITISWEAVNRPMPTSVSTQQGYLLFQGIRTSDAGRYVCKARNSIAESTAVAEVIVNAETSYVPIVKAINKMVSVYEGGKVELQCSADATIVVEWSKHSGRNCCALPQQAMVSGNTLIIEFADLDDAGRYVCTGVSPSGSSNSDYIELTVNRARNPKLAIIPSVDVVKIGGNIDLKCEPSGIPKSLLSWTKVGDRLGGNVQVLENVLRITDVTTNNNGMYMCSARTTGGLQESKYILDVRDQYGRPTLNSGNGSDGKFDYDNGNNGYDENEYTNGNDVDDNDDDDDDVYENGNGYNGDDSVFRPYDDAALEVKSADVGKTMVLSCKTDLEPPVDYTWSKLGMDLPANAHANGSMLILSKVTEKDAGLYLCVAINGDVRMEIPMIVTVTGLIPSFHQNPISYVAMPMLLDAHTSFDIEITFKPEQPDGLILYNGQLQKDGDFISFGLKSGRPEFRFEVGSGPGVISTNRPVRLNQWHTVRLTRNKKEGEMIVDGGGAFKGTSPGRYQGLDLDQPLYLGSVPSFDKINPLNGFSSGFVGCISELKIGGMDKPITRDYAIEWEGIGGCETCKDHACQNGGACQQARNDRGYVCLCPRGFSDSNCAKRGESCFAGACGTGECIEAERGIKCKCPIDKTGDRCEKHQTIKTPQFSSNSYIAYQLIKSQPKLKMTVMFKAADSSDGILLYSAPENSNHFVSLSIKNRKLEFLYDNGYGLAQVWSNREVSPGEWEVATIGSEENEIYLNFHEYQSTAAKSASQKLATGSLLYLGGVDPSLRINPSVGVRKGFTGCVSSIDVHSHSLNVVWSAKEALGITECLARESVSSITCRPNTCKNNGVCSIKNNRVSCTCRPGFSGAYCEKIEDECVSANPCKNGGTCEKTPRGDVQCLCPPGIAGSHCEHRLEGDVSFNGNGYLELEHELMQHDDPSDTEVIEMEFTTTTSEGLLLWQSSKEGYGGESDFIAIAVVSGDIEVSYELGSGPARIRINDGHRVDDGRRHRVVVTRTGMDAQIVLDSTHEASGSSEGYQSRLNTPGNIFIGGAPDINRITSGKYSHGFSGCVHRLRLPHQGDIDLTSQPLRTLHGLPCSNTNMITEEDEGPKRGDSWSNRWGRSP